MGSSPSSYRTSRMGYYPILLDSIRRPLGWVAPPKCWKTMKVVFIPKMGKADYGQAKSYRPITLSNFILKGMERLTQWFINDHVVKGPLYAQHAYTAGLSCDTAVSEVVDFIEKNTYRNQKVLAVSLDCSGAFDRIQFDSAEEAMSKAKVPANIRTFYMNVLQDRTVRAELQGESVRRRPRRGSPQGGVLSPLIWILIMNGILTAFVGSEVKVVGYADDIILLIAGKDPATLVERMNEALEKVLRWGRDNGLVFNPDKTCAIRFSMARKKVTWKKVRMGTREVDYEDSMKYLGVTLQSHLTWGAHTDERIRKATATINLANAAIGQKWGFTPDKALWVYTAMARSVSTYGALVWAQHITDSIKNRLQRLQRKALLGMSHSMRSTPTAGMEVVAGLLPLDLQTQLVATNSRFRTRQLLRDSWDGLGTNKKGHRRNWDDIINRYCDPNLPVDSLANTRLWLENREIQNPEIVLYTDGSKTDGGRTGAGWAACHGDTILAEESTYLGTMSTVFQAEVVAIDRAVRWVTENLEPSTTVLVRSDSQAAIKAIYAASATSKLVQSCKEVIQQALQTRELGIQWIRGHADHTGNELADMLAKKGTHTACDMAYPAIPLPVAAVKAQITKHFFSKWQKRWATSGGCRQTKIFYPAVDGRRLKKLSRMDRASLNLLMQAATGHALVGYHLSKWAGQDSQCKLCCEEEESIEHLYFKCPALELQRHARGAWADAFSSSLEYTLLHYFRMEELQSLFSDRSAGLGDGDRVADQGAPRQQGPNSHNRATDRGTEQADASVGNRGGTPARTGGRSCVLS